MSTKYGLLPSDAISAGGLTGATAASRYAGATASGAPTSGTFAVGDYVVDQSGSFWICTTAGSPGTWTQVVAGGGGGGGVTPPAGDLGGNTANPTVISTHLSSPLPIAQGGTASSSQVWANLLTPIAVTTTTSVTAAAGNFIPVDNATPNADVNVTLPTAPADLTTIGVKLVRQSIGLNVVNVKTGGSDTFNDDGTTTATLKVLNHGGIWQYKASASVWYRMSNDIPLSSLMLVTGGAFTGAVAPAVATLTDAATIGVNAALGNHFRVTLGGSRTLGTPTNPTDGQKIMFEVIQDGTGARTLAYSAAYAFSTGIPQPTLTTTANKRDFIGFVYNSTASLWYCVAFVNGF